MTDGMVTVMLSLELWDTTTKSVHHLTRTVRLAVPPRSGEAIELTPGGWSEVVRRVWHHLEDGAVAIEFAGVNYASDGEDLLADALAAGWEDDDA